ncbi:MAG: STAS domain-containing protein [Rhodocyclaceae bacterium]|nr:STAS domain-containing protein [Rhodocyclaceae bacterium]
MPQIRRVSIERNMTIYEAESLKEELVDAVHGAPDGLELDLSRVAEMDTAGFQLLVLAKNESRRLERPLAIVAHSPAVLDVIEFYNMLAFFGDPVVIAAEDAR